MRIINISILAITVASIVSHTQPIHAESCDAVLAKGVFEEWHRKKRFDGSSHVRDYFCSYNDTQAQSTFSTTASNGTAGPFSTWRGWNAGFNSSRYRQRRNAYCSNRNYTHRTEYAFQELTRMASRPLLKAWKDCKKLKLTQDAGGLFCQSSGRKDSYSLSVQYLIGQVNPSFNAEIELTSATNAVVDDAPAGKVFKAGTNLAPGAALIKDVRIKNPKRSAKLIINAKRKDGTIVSCQVLFPASLPEPSNCCHCEFVHKETSQELPDVNFWTYRDRRGCKNICRTQILDRTYQKENAFDLDEDGSSCRGN